MRGAALWALCAPLAQRLAWCGSERQWGLLSRLVEALGGGEELRLSLSVSGLPTLLALTREELWDLYLPLVLLAAGAAACKEARLLMGVAGAAGSGKSTLCAAAVVVGNAWHRIMLEEDAGYRAAWGASSEELFAALSMDAYHRTNADLAASGLAAHKGRIDTISAVLLAADLQRVRAADEHTTVLLPEYDRAVTHNPVQDVVKVHACHRVVLVEGLYMCSGRSSGVGDASTARGPTPVDPAWHTVRGLLDGALFIDAPLSLCRARATARWAAAKEGGATEPGDECALQARALAHFEAVDAPTWRALQDDLLQPPPALWASLLACKGEGGEGGRPPFGAEHAPSEGCGPDVVLSLQACAPSASAGQLARASADAFVVAVTLRERAWRPCSHALMSPPAPADALAARPASRVLVTGLSPCVQRSLMFPGGWERGGVNRAGQVEVGFGGKGQHVALALARCAAGPAAVALSPAPAAAEPSPSPSPPPLAIELVQFLGGESGAAVARWLEEALQAAAGAGAPAAAFTSLAVSLPQATRSCLTLLDARAGDMTELVEPPAPVPPAAAAALLALASARLPGAAALCLMGSAPPGAEGLPRALSAAAAAMPAAARPWLLLDAAQRLRETLAAGGVACLKINAEELQAACRAEEAAEGEAPTRDAGSGEPALDAGGGEPPAGRSARIARLAHSLLARFAPAGLRAVAITDGPLQALLLEELGEGGRRSTRYALPPLPAPALNPIGAGDAVAGVCTWAHAVAGEPLRLAFARGLAAGSASCLTMRGCVWEAALAAQLLGGITAVSEVRREMRAGY